jgi:hypothetical protein
MDTKSPGDEVTLHHQDPEVRGWSSGILKDKRTKLSSGVVSPASQSFSLQLSVTRYHIVRNTCDTTNIDTDTHTLMDAYSKGC